jgi:hypothetical protein
MKMCRVDVTSKKIKLCTVFSFFLLLGSVKGFSQDGAAGIEDANSMVREYFDVGINLMYAIGAVLGLIGGVRVYQRWSAGDPNTGQTAASWFGSCIFLVIVATVLRSFFGL